MVLLTAVTDFPQFTNTKLNVQISRDKLSNNLSALPIAVAIKH